MLVGSAMLIDRVFNIPIDIGDWWPMLIVLMGVVIVMRAFGGPRVKVRKVPGLVDDPMPGVAPESPASGAPSTESTISEFAMWAGKQRRISSPAFKVGDMESPSTRTMDRFSAEVAVSVFSHRWSNAK